jgi:hypothetical protein
MISPETGSIEIAEGIKIASDILPGEVTESLIIDRNGWGDRDGRRWTILTLHPSTYGYRMIHATLTFCDDALFSARLGISDGRFGTGWSDWSEEKEIQRKSEHDLFLDEVLGERREFPWGTVWSEFDRKSASSSFGVNYNQQRTSRIVQPLPAV